MRLEIAEFGCHKWIPELNRIAVPADPRDQTEESNSRAGLIEEPKKQSSESQQCCGKAYGHHYWRVRSTSAIGNKKIMAGIHNGKVPTRRKMSGRNSLQ
jgi:hypothetical protein